ncbi:MAG: HU family DNA-binding protein [Pseudoflavonifractor sp.]|nr:HU family DNA-binding protein [Pseudoflavonifractor sp.]
MDNKTVVATLSRKLGRDAKDINSLLEGLGAILKEKCGNMDSVAIPGFGTFEPEKKDEYVMTDGTTGRKTLYPPKIELQFKAGSMLRKRLTSAQ